MTLLKVENLTVEFDTDEGRIVAVDDVSFQLEPGQVMGLVGESGSGKSVTAKSIMRLNPDNAVYSGNSRITLDLEGGRVDVLRLRSNRELRIVRGGAVSMIFQEPMASFAPAITIGDQMVEQLQLHRRMSKAAARDHSVHMLERVGISDAGKRFGQYAFELSGGMRQRAMIAMALSTQPKLLIADEPTTALDVTIQAQVIELMKDLVAEFHMGIIFITHDLGVVAEMCDEVAVMYLGKIVEKTDVDSAFFDPKHPYTQALLRSIPRLEGDEHERLAVIKGNVPDPSVVPLGCPFHPRCPEFMPGICNEIVPEPIPIDGGREVRCLLYDKSHSTAQAAQPAVMETV